MNRLSIGLLTSLLSFGLLSACGNDSESPEVVDASLPAEADASVELHEVGLAQKGPFRTGAKATVYPVNPAGERLPNRELYCGINGDARMSCPMFGRDGYPWAWVDVTGMAFNEYTGNDETMTLGAYVRIDEYLIEGNINLISAIISARARSLVENENVPLLDEAWALALADAFEAFGVAGDPFDIDVLGDGVANRRALWLSAAFLAAEVDIDLVLADFADNGSIDGDGLSAWNAVRDASTNTMMDEALAKVNAEFGTSLVRQEVRLPGVSRVCATAEQLCVGQNVSVAIVSNESSYTPIQILESGTYMLEAQHSAFNNFNRSLLRSADSLAQTTTGQGFAPMINLGLNTVMPEGGAYNNGVDNGTALLVLTKVGDGAPTEPHYIPLDISVDGQVSRQMSKNISYYAVESAGTSRVFVSDIALEATLEVKAYVYDGFTKGMELAAGTSAGTSMMVDLPAPSPLVLIEVTNLAAQGTQSGLSPYTIRAE